METKSKNQQSGFGITGMILGILAVLSSAIFIGGALGITAAAFSIVGLTQKNRSHGTAIAGLVLGIVAMSVVAGNLIGKELVQSIIESNPQTEDETYGSSERDSDKDKNITEGEDNEDGKIRLGGTWKNKYVLVSFDDCGIYESDNQFIQPEDGNKYVYATFTFENVGKSDTTVAYWDFDCYADGYACEGTYGADDSGFSQTLSVGRKVTGSVYFEVPENASEIEFEFSPSFWTSEKVVFVYQ